MRYLTSYKLFENSGSIYAKSYDSYGFNQFLFGKPGQDVNDLEKRIRFFHYPMFPTDSVYYSVLFDGDKVIGICKIDTYKDLEPNQMEIAYCSIDREYRGKGYLNILIEELVRLCKEKGFSLGASRWTVPGMIKLRPVVTKWTEKYGVEFRDHDRRFDYSHLYNADMVNINEMTPKELEEHQRISHLKPKYKGIFKKIFYDTGDYKIYSTQTDFNQEKIDKIFKDINSNKYDYFSDDGKIAGYFYKGKYYITEGHHRILAALKYWRKYNDYRPVDKMIKNGNFEEKNPVSDRPRRFPSKFMESLDNIRFELEHNDVRTNVNVVIGDSVVGYLSFTHKDDGFSHWNKYYELEGDKLSGESIHIIGVSVYPNKMNLGVGRKLVEWVENYSKEEGYNYVTLASITDALGFWKKLGYNIYALGDFYAMYKEI